jgi:hypothetical protein
MCRLTLFWHDKVLLTDLPKKQRKASVFVLLVYIPSVLSTRIFQV